MTSPSPTRSRTAARRAVPGVALVALVALVAASCGGGSSEPSGPTLPPQAGPILAASAAAMADVESVRFEVRRSGAPVYIDAFDSIGLEAIVGEFEVPGSAQAVLDVEVNDSLKTQLGAIAVGEEVWLSNPVTGRYETLPDGYDIDPSKFFDPRGGWQPLLAGLTEVELIGREDRGGDRYHVRGRAPAERITAITAGLIRNQEVTVDLWIQPVTGLVHLLEFSTELDGAVTDWTVDLRGYGDDYDIAPPPEGG